MRILFVGGIQDGKCKNVDEPLRPLVRMIQLEPPKLDFTKPPEPEDMLEGTGTMYRLMKIHGDNKSVFNIYVSEEFSNADVFRLLINNYRPIV